MKKVQLVPGGGELRVVACPSDNVGRLLLGFCGITVPYRGVVKAGEGEGVRQGMGKAFLPG